MSAGKKKLRSWIKKFRKIVSKPKLGERCHDSLTVWKKKEGKAFDFNMGI